MTATIITFPQRPEHHDQGDNTEPAAIVPVVYTVKETAHLLSLSLTNTYALIRSGQIPAKKIGGRWAVPKRRFHEWVDSLPEASVEDIPRELEALEKAERRGHRNGA